MDGGRTWKPVQATLVETADRITYQVDQTDPDILSGKQITYNLDWVEVETEKSPG